MELENPHTKPPDWMWYVVSTSSGILSVEASGVDHMPIVVIGNAVDTEMAHEERETLRYGTAARLADMLNGAPRHPDVYPGTRLSAASIRTASGVAVHVIYDRSDQIPPGNSPADCTLDRMLLTQAIWTGNLHYAYRLAT